MSNSSLSAGGVSVTLTPDQADALHLLAGLPGVVMLEVAACEHMSLRVAAYFAAAHSDEDAPLTDARWYTVSVAGTVREQVPDPEPAL